MAFLDRIKYFIIKRRSLAWKFHQIYVSGGFEGANECLSGPGSTLEATEKLRSDLSELFRELKVERLLDAPCGDFHWMQFVDLGLIQYHGIDIVPEIAEANGKRFAGPNRTFSCGDLRSTNLPPADLVLCRDCLVHLSNRDARRVLRKFVQTRAKWIMLTTFPVLGENRDLASGMGWRPLNLQRPPFNLPPPIRSLPEAENDSAGGPKVLGLWPQGDVERSMNSQEPPGP